MANLFWASERQWFIWITSDELAVLREYADRMRAFLRERKSRPAPDDLPIDDDDEGARAGWDIHEEKYGVQFPNMLTTSLLISTDIFVETWLKNICEALEKAKPEVLVRRTDIKGRSVIDQIQTFLKRLHGVSNFPDQSPEWIRLRTYHVIRNAIVHSNGRLSDTELRMLRDFQRTNPTLIEIEDDLVRPSFEGCLDCIATSEAFLRKLLESMEDWDEDPQIELPEA